MIFLGNSRAEAHFDPAIIEKNTGITAYNFGLSGSSMQIEQLRWKSYLAHNKAPEIVVQNIDLYAFSDKPIANKQQYLPYYNEPVLYDELEKIDPTVRYEKYIPMSKYRGFEFQILEAFGLKTGSKTKRVKGYLSHHASWNNDFLHYKQSLHGKKINYPKAELVRQCFELQKIIADCKHIHAKLILVWTPQYFELSELEEPTLSQVKKQMEVLARKNKVVFWDFSTQPINRDKKFFYNSFHLNDVGVDAFCKQFSDSLNCYYKKPIP